MSENYSQSPMPTLSGVERAAYAFKLILAKKARDNHGHFYSEDGASCPHKNGTKANNPKNRQGKNPQRKQGKLKLPQGFKPLELSDVYKRIGGANSEQIMANDGKYSKFSQMGINHFKNKDREERKKRLKSLEIAKDTIKTGCYFKSYIPKTKVLQTEFIKKYNNKFYYTVRRKETGEVYSWHDLSPSKFKRKMKDYNDYHKKGIIK